MADAVEIRNLKAFRRELANVGKEWPKELSKAHREMATRIAALARAEASGYGGIRAKAAPAIRGYGSATAAFVGASTSRYPYANAAFWGEAKHSGWYAKPQYSGSKGKQFPPWVGNAWEPGVAGTGPYAINNAIAANLPAMMRTFEKAIDSIAKRAGLE